ncbi:uncharacterized protein LOC111056429 [Nilaparvata lugens]|uniref:uncharacterized protein LOC111056429 n=1 Tax=Nilaparvata lugens TaxID=108931 RepID=UPI00193CD200|nr:uncharacterized protein LOC111056429 [Nilaparvata lugens]
MDAEQSSKADKPLSILERFRQLSKDKEREKLEASKPKPAPTVSAIYLSKNDKTSSQKFGNDRGWKQNKWGILIIDMIEEEEVGEEEKEVEEEDAIKDGETGEEEKEEKEDGREKANTIAEMIVKNTRIKIELEN